LRVNLRFQQPFIRALIHVNFTENPVAARLTRVLAQPIVGKVEVTAKLCRPDGLVIAKVPRRAKVDYARARRWRDG